MKWQDITIKQFAEIVACTNAELNDLDRSLELIRIVNNQSVVGEVALKDFAFELEKLAFMNEKMPTHKVRKEYHFGKTDYILTDKVENITVAQYIDYQNYIKLDQPNEQKMALFLSVFLIPKGHKYNDGYDISGVQLELDNYCPAYIAQSLAFFLQNKFARYTKLTRLYLQVMSRWTIWRTKRMLKRANISKAERDRVTHLLTEWQNATASFGL